MNKIASQFRRIFCDDGRGDRDFSKQEERLRQAQEHLRQATESLTKAAGLLADEVQMNGLP